MPIKIERDDESAINLTPMIDIVFLLIIFFMVGTHFTKLNEAERDIKLQVPAVSDAEALTSAPRKRIINVYQDGQIILDKKPVSLDELQTELATARQQYQKLGVVVRGDGDGRYQRVAEVIATCRKADISDLNIAVQNVTVR
jgi:biopolymer transport protein ExbD